MQQNTSDSLRDLRWHLLPPPPQRCLGKTLEKLLYHNLEFPKGIILQGHLFMGLILDTKGYHSPPEDKIMEAKRDTIKRGRMTVDTDYQTLAEGTQE
jgi:hypothetical protein